MTTVAHSQSTAPLKTWVAGLATFTVMVWIGVLAKAWIVRQVTEDPAAIVAPSPAAARLPRNDATGARAVPAMGSIRVPMITPMVSPNGAALGDTPSAMRRQVLPNQK